MKNTRILNILVAVVMIIGMILWIRTGMADEDGLKTNADLQASILNPFTYLTFFLLLVAGLTAVGFSMLNIVKHPDALKRSLMGLAAMAVILLIAYFMSSDSGVVMDILGKEELATATVSRWVSTGIWYSVILGGIGLFSFVVDFAKSFAK